MVVLIAEPHRVRRQALSRGIGSKSAATVAHQAGGGRNPQFAGVVLEQIGHGIAFELGCIFRVKGNEIDAIEADQASVGAQPHKAIARLQDGMDSVLGQAGIGPPGLMAVWSSERWGSSARAEVVKASNRTHTLRPRRPVRIMMAPV